MQGKYILNEIHNQKPNFSNPFQVNCNYLVDGMLIHCRFQMASGSAGPAFLAKADKTH
jgi:hypothetical protein